MKSAKNLEKIYRLGPNNFFIARPGFKERIDLKNDYQILY